jgi:alpha-glucosidase
VNGLKINKNITRYIFGSSVNTDAVILETNKIKEDNSCSIKYLDIDEAGILSYDLGDDDIVYGLGENVRGLNKRGWIYESFCTDEYSHTPNKKSLYGAHNFMIIYGEESFGVFIDSPSKITFDVGYTDYNKLKIISENQNYDLYIIQGDTLKSIVKEFRMLIGESYAPPKWAFGYGQSRWGYGTEYEAREVIRKFRENNIPLEMLYLDIDYMDKFKDFTVDRDAFPSFEDLISDCTDQGIKVIPIMDAGIKVEEGYPIYDEGLEKGYFCTDKDGKPFVTAVWPGKVHLPDFLNSKARKWFGSKYKILTDKGIEGFWNDMNEPALFYSEKGLEEAYKRAEEIKDENIDVYSYFELKDNFNRLANSIDDYKSIYHNVDGKLINHYDVHNLYGLNMTKAACEGLESIDKDKRFLLFSRASSVGMHRYGGMWTGDTFSWWEHIELTLKMLPGLNMCGFMFIGSDTGGFAGDTTSDLLIRWNQLSLFTPLYRNHTSRWSRSQEPYAFDERTTNIIRNIISFRYSLIPYLYSEIMKSIKDNDMYFKPLTFEYDDEFSKEVEDQQVLGDSLMIAPIYRQNAKGRYVYLPEKMLLCKLNSEGKLIFEVCNEGNRFFYCKLEETIFFIRKNKMLPLVETKNRVKDLSLEELNLIVFVDQKAEYTLYDDDGTTKEYRNNKFNLIKLVIEKKNNKYELKVEKNQDTILKKVNVIIYDLEGRKETIVRDL